MYIKQQKDPKNTEKKVRRNATMQSYFYKLNISTHTHTQYQINLKGYMHIHRHILNITEECQPGGKNEAERDDKERKIMHERELAQVSEGRALVNGEWRNSFLLLSPRI